MSGQHNLLFQLCSSTNEQVQLWADYEFPRLRFGIYALGRPPTNSSISPKFCQHSRRFFPQKLSFFYRYFQLTITLSASVVRQITTHSRYAFLPFPESPSARTSQTAKNYIESCTKYKTQISSPHRVTCNNFEKC